MSILRIFKLIDSDDYVYNVDETSLIAEMNKKVSNFFNIIDMESNIMLVNRYTST